MASHTVKPIDTNQHPKYQPLMNLHTISVEILKEAIAIKEQLVALEQKLAKIAGGEIASIEKIIKKGRKTMSAAAKAKIAAAAKARLAKTKIAVVKADKAVVSSVKKRTLSPEHKAKLMAAVKARWAKAKGTVDKAVVKSVKKAKRQLSPEGRARIVAALKKRWAGKKKI